MLTPELAAVAKTRAGAAAAEAVARGWARKEVAAEAEDEEGGGCNSGGRRLQLPNCWSLEPGAVVVAVAVAVPGKRSVREGGGCVEEGGRYGAVVEPKPPDSGFKGEEGFRMRRGLNTDTDMHNTDTDRHRRRQTQADRRHRQSEADTGRRRQSEADTGRHTHTHM